VGLDIRTAEFLMFARNHGVDFGIVATLGRQRVMLEQSERRLLSSWLGRAIASDEVYADEFLKSLGARDVNAVDASRYEGANIIHNLNEPLSAELASRFSCLIDGGTLEHVFDIKQSMKSCMQMVKPGGHIIICQMANNCMGHGFYQFSPEFFHSTLTPENGYRVKFMALYEGGVWYEPAIPGEIGDRVQARTREETFIFVIAERIADVVPFNVPPHQSDYVSNLESTVGKGEDGKASQGSAIGAVVSFRRLLGRLKREYLYTALPWAAKIEERMKRRAISRPDRLSNSRRFRRIGSRLSVFVGGLLLVASRLEPSGALLQFIQA
jgi:hypothetical protein